MNERLSSSIARRHRVWSGIAVRGLGFLAAAYLLLGTPPARAQVPDALYDDVKAVIEELLSGEVARSVVPQLICRSGRRDVTAQAFGAVQLGGGGYVAFEASTHFPRSLQRIYSRQFASLRSTIRDEAADYAAYLLYSSLHAGLISGSGTNPEQKAAIASYEQLTTVRASKFSGVSEAAEELLVISKGPAVLPSTAAPINWAPLESAEMALCTGGVSKLLQGGKFTTPERPLLEVECGGISVSYECNIALAMRAALQGKGPVAEDLLVRAISSVMVQHLVPAGQEATIPSVFPEMVLSLREFLASPQSTSDALAGKLSAILTRAGVVLSGASVGAALDGVDSLRNQWQLIGAGGTIKIDPANFIAIITSTSGYVGHVCVGKSDLACRVVNRLQTSGDAGVARLLQLVRLASRGDYREVAHLAIRAMFAETDDSHACKDGCPAIAVYRDFADAVVLYALDVTDGNVPTEATRQAFRNAAIEVIRRLGEGGGVYRTYWQTILLPDLGLRFSWNAAYVNPENTGSRVVASANLLNFRIPLRQTELTFVAVQFSLLDPIAPLAELASRRSEDVIYRSTGNLGLNIFAPRVEFMAGIPALSRHLVISAGASLRLAVPLKVDDISTETVDGYRYYLITHDSDAFPRYLEFGFALKYLI